MMVHVYVYASNVTFNVYKYIHKQKLQQQIIVQRLCQRSMKKQPQEESPVRHGAEFQPPCVGVNYDSWKRGHTLEN